MSNLSDIGFDIQSEEEFHALLKKAYERSTPLKTNKGTYYRFSDESGAELWIQMNKRNELIGANPHFKGKSKHKVAITSTINRPESILDGAFHSWANPMDDDNPESGAYPFVFDVPNHKKYDGIEIPQMLDIQLAAFAQEFEYYKSENAFENEQEGEPKWTSQSFIPSGLFNPGGGEAPDPPEALGLFAGIISEAEKMKNQLTGQEFYWMLVDTLGGEVDVLADLRFFENNAPETGGVVHGQFWLSGSLIEEPRITEKSNKGLWNRLFGTK
ncbi:MAG: hypothetical protein CL840_01640 [Crocinitomicaceae bacterium]|mgnify:CR=1 FL=1|nr:hypothetical protein [Crocinitomicaceae bacterium]|tara:strand:- start:10679 stop:11491 length:813 start_codon:yes stop_codon:yes gene_type:complete